jgi:putative transposase
MAIRKAIFTQGCYYHVYNRGVNKDLIFRSHENYIFLLRRVKELSTEWHIKVIAYCLMPNHYHLVVRQDSEKPVSGFMQAVFNSYTKAFNKMYNRTGTLFEGPFRAIAISNDRYLTHICRYVHRNPLEAGLVADPRDWTYSDYSTWIDASKEELNSRRRISDWFDTTEHYKEFVLNYVPPKDIDTAIRRLAG